jgi:hypothetical protein
MLIQVMVESFHSLTQSLTDARVELYLRSCENVDIGEAVKTSEKKSVKSAPQQGLERIVRERLQSLQQDKKTASSWPDVKRRILQRRPES